MIFFARGLRHSQFHPQLPDGAIMHAFRILLVYIQHLRQRGTRTLRSHVRRCVPGRFQPYNYTLPNRYPWLFDFARTQLRSIVGARLLSFGCSRGDEVFALRTYFPGALITGIDIDRRNINACIARAKMESAAGLSFVTAATIEAERSEKYDAIFCLAVLCHGDLTTSGSNRSEPLLRFDDFERMVTDFARCLKPGGLLLLHTTNFRFCDTAVATAFDTVLQAELDQLASDVLFDRNNRLMPGVRYRAVAFRKHMSVCPPGLRTQHAASTADTSSTSKWTLS